MVPPAFTVTPAMIGDVAVSVWAVTGFPVSLTITVFLIQRSLRERLAFSASEGDFSALPAALHHPAALWKGQADTCLRVVFVP